MTPVWIAFCVAAIVWLPLGFVLGLLAMKALTESAIARAEAGAFARGKAVGRESLWCSIEGDLRRRAAHAAIAEAFAEPKDAA